MTLKVRHLYRDMGDHLAYRQASEYVWDPRDLDAAGNPPAWARPHHPIEALPDEREFDHTPTVDELKEAFPLFFARNPPA